MSSTRGDITSLPKLWNRRDNQAFADLMVLVSAGRLDPGRDRRNSFFTMEWVHGSKVRDFPPDAH